MIKGGSYMTTATFTQRSTSIVLKGVLALLLKSYALRRKEEPWPEGGWMSTEDTLESWNALASYVVRQPRADRLGAREGSIAAGAGRGDPPRVAV
jgi:hypothetical protein